MPSACSSSTSRRAFLKRASLSLGGIPFTLSLPGFPSRLDAEAPNLDAAGALPRSKPEAEGVATQGILDFLDAVTGASMELHSFMMLRHGKVIAEGWWEPYGPQFAHTMYSMSKSFTSTAVGFAVAEGKLKVTDKVISFFPDDLPEKVGDHLKAMEVRHLLTMATGNEKEPTGAVTREENWVKTFLAQEFSHEPGSVFMYNSAATYMCSAIVQKVTGQAVLEYLTPRLFTPLGITGMKWETCPRGINTGGWGLSIQTEGLAKFGQWLLQKGKWNGQQLIPASWIEEASSKHIQQPGGDKPDRPMANNDWLQGYGYQFWRCQGNANIFRGDGAFGQFTLVLPEHDAVIVMTSENSNLQGQLDLVWKHLLPAIDFKGNGNGEAGATLSTRLASLKLPGPKGDAASEKVDTMNKRKYELEKNDLGLTEVSFSLRGNACVFTAKAGDKTHTITCGMDSWVRGEAAIPGTPPRLISGGAPKETPVSKIAATAAWTSPFILTMRWQYYETPHHDTVTCEFQWDTVTLTFLNSISGMRPKAKDARGPIKGTAV